jgi:hypothetical protein
VRVKWNIKDPGAIGALATGIKAAKEKEGRDGDGQITGEGVGGGLGVGLLAGYDSD